MYITAFLERHRLPKVWLYERLKTEGFDISESFLSRIISGERNSELAEEVRAACVSICRRYERGMCNAETPEK